MLAIEKEGKPEKLFICLDPMFLNQAIIKPKYHILSISDIVAQPADEKAYLVFDMSEGFWQMILDTGTTLSFLTTFQTIFGQVCFLKMCFGIRSPPEIFMKTIMEMFGDIKGDYP